MKKVLFSILIITFVMVFISCNQSEQPVNTNNQSENSSNESDFYIQSIDELIAFDEATLDDEPKYWGDRRRDRSDNDRMHRRHNGMFLGKVFRAMDLSDRQMYAIRGFMSDYMDCLRRVMAGTMETRRAIMHRARQASVSIIRALRAGEITREMARAQLRRLNHRIHEALRNEIDWTLRCRCIRNLFANIQGVLTTRDQMAMWQRFLNSLDGPCFGADSRD